MNLDIYMTLFVADYTRYGSIDQRGVSITEREYERAFANQKRILIVLIDEAKHPVLPKDVETGAGAQKLAAFKALLKTRHVCGTFCSPEDLALKIAIALTRLLGIDERRDIDQSRVEELTKQVPALLAASGCGVTLKEHVTDLSGMFATGQRGELIVGDTRLRELIAAGFIATQLSSGDYTVLKDIMTFDKGFWSLLILLVGYYRIDSALLRSELAACNDPVRLRVLVKLAGELKFGECTETLCAITLSQLPKLGKEFDEMHLGPVTSLDAVMKAALSSMPRSSLPTIVSYLEKARSLKRWKPKQIFEAATHALESRE